MFCIFPKDKPFIMEDELVLPVEIVINDFQEEFYISLTYWNFEDYQESWLKSLERGLTDKDHAALAVSMYEPRESNFIFIWVIYFDGDNAHIQNNVLFLDEYQCFTPNKINEFIEPRTTHDEDGTKISEWNTDLKSVINFYESLKKKNSLG